jgi:hypothetical protein
MSALRIDNARLIALRESDGVEWRPPLPSSLPAVEPLRLSTDEPVGGLTMTMPEALVPIQSEDELGP